MKIIIPILLSIIPVLSIANTAKRMVLLPSHAGDIIILSNSEPKVIEWTEEGRCIDYIQTPDKLSVVSIAMAGDPVNPDYYLICQLTENPEEKTKIKINTPEDMTISTILDISDDASVIIVKVSLKKKTETQNIIKQMYGLIELETGSIKPIKF